jgi:3-hydroxyisobutyrate dehydrogenase
MILRTVTQAVSSHTDAKDHSMPVTATPPPAGFGGVGFVGLGDMGGPMADNLVAAGFDVTVFDTRAGPLEGAVAKGAKAARSLQEMPGRCASIGICVWSDEQLIDAVFGAAGLLSAKSPALTLIIHSTVRPQTVERIASAFEARGWAVLDAPVSGGRAASLKGQLSLMVGGDEALFARHAPYFNCVGLNVFHVGARAGLGEVAKLCNNLMGLCNAFAILEALKLGAAYGVEEDVIRRVAAVSTGNSWYVENWGFVDNLIQTHPQPDILYKDLWEATYAAKDKGLQLVITGLVALTAPRLMKERHIDLLARAAATTSLPAPKPAASPKPSGAEQALRSAESDYNAAAKSWDVDAMAACYTEDVLFFGGRPGMSMGRDGVHAYYASYVGVIRSSQLELLDQQLVQLAPDTYLAQGHGRFNLVLANGQSTQTTLRSTVVIVLRDGRWKFRQHHFSATPDAPSLGNS